MITLYHAPRSRSSRIIWLLEEMGVPYAIAPVSIFRPMTGEGVPDGANPHPDKRVPAILHDGVLVAESLAIVLYLAEAFPASGLAPAVGAPDRGDYLTWLAWYVAEFEPALFAGMAGDLAESPQKRRDHEAVVRRLEAALARGPYAMGESFSGADILIASALGFARAAFPPSAAFDAYLERCRARPAAVRGAARDSASGPQAPAKVT